MSPPGSHPGPVPITECCVALPLVTGPAPDPTDPAAHMGDSNGLADAGERPAPYSQKNAVVLAQLIQLGVAWSFKDGDTVLVAAALAIVALVVIAGILHPRSIAALAADD